MAPPKRTLTIGRPFDARHISGVNVTGSSSMQSSLREASSTTAPTKTTLGSGSQKSASSSESSINAQHANTVDNMIRETGSLRRTRGHGLGIKRSLSRLRNRSRSSSISPVRRNTHTKETEHGRPRKDSAHDEREDTPPPERSHSSLSIFRTASRSRAKTLDDEKIRPRRLLDDAPREDHAQHERPKSRAVEALQKSKTAYRSLDPKVESNDLPLRAYEDLGESGLTCQDVSIPAYLSHRRPQPRSRPLGFKEIMAVSSTEERMRLYKRTRDFWASVDHGLDEWVWRAGMGGNGMMV